MLTQSTGITVWTLSQWLWIIVNYAEPVVVKHWVILSQWLWVIVCYAEPNAWEAWCAILSKWLCSIVCHYVLCRVGCVGIMVCYTEQWMGITVWMLCQWVWFMVRYAKWVVVNHGESCCASGCESCWVMLRQLLWTMANHAVPVGVNHVVLF